LAPLTLPVPQLTSLFHFSGRSKERDQVRGWFYHCVSSGILGYILAKPSHWSTTSYQLSATLYSMYLQSLSISGNRLLHCY